MKILILVAGTNTPSNADTLADACASGIQNTHGDVTVQKLFLRDLPLDPFNVSYYDPATDQGTHFATIRQALTEADGLVIASPIWNFSVPGHLKNLIDRLGSFCLDAQSRSIGQLKGMPAFLIFTGGSPSAAWTGLQRRTVSHVPVSLRYFGAVVTGQHYEGRCTPGRGTFGLVVDKRPGSLEAMRNKGAHFAALVSHFKKTGKLPLRETILYWLFQTGQNIKKRLGL